MRQQKIHCLEGYHVVLACPSGTSRLEGSEEDTVIGSALLGAFGLDFVFGGRHCDKILVI